MGWFRRRRGPVAQASASQPTVIPPARPIPELPVATPVLAPRREASAPAPKSAEAMPKPVPSRAKTLHTLLSRIMVRIPMGAVAAEWAARGTPSAVVDAFFMFPHDGAVDFFERDVMPLEVLANDLHPRTVKFTNSCRLHTLATLVSESAQDRGPEATVRSILEGLSDNDETMTTLVRAIGRRGVLV